VGYYLVNYKRESALADCETIDIIEEMSKFKRLALALELAVSCLKYVNVPAAYNLAGRILEKAGHEREVFEAISGVIKECVSGKSLEGLGEVGECSEIKDCLELARLFFKAASDKAYVYACNNMAVAVAEKIVWGDRNDKENVDRYAEYLRLAADRYEPYAANRLGLFYACGEVRCSDGAVNLREYVDMPKAKEYFLKATRYPDANSAWAYFNLIKYFHKDYIKDIDLLGKHMDEIKRLNPEVYDLAMEL
jgi:TPR repeat protein